MMDDESPRGINFFH